MALYPEMMDLMDMFPTEKACLEYLRLVRWPEGYGCPRCASKAHVRQSRGRYRCRDCGYEGSVTSGTLVHDTHKPLRLWFHAIWYGVNQKHGVSALGLQKALGLGSYQSPWEWLHKLRRAMLRPERDRLSGLVEMDETFIGGERSGPRGRGAEGKTLVLIAAEQAAKGSAVSGSPPSSMPPAKR